MAKGTGKAYYMISVVAQRYNIHPQTLRLYEREGLLKPSRTDGNTRLYSDEDLERLETILSLTRDLGVNLAGVEIILNMRGPHRADAGRGQRVHAVREARDGQGPGRLGAAAEHRDGQVDARRPRPAEPRPPAPARPATPTVVDDEPPIVVRKTRAIGSPRQARHSRAQATRPGSALTSGRTIS